MIIEKIFDILSRFHHFKIALFSKNLNFNNLIDVGCHRGEFLKSFLRNIQY